MRGGLQGAWSLTIRMSLTMRLKRRGRVFLPVSVFQWSGVLFVMVRVFRGCLKELYNSLVQDLKAKCWILI